MKVDEAITRALRAGEEDDRELKLAAYILVGEYTQLIKKVERLQRELRIKVQIVDEQHDAMSDKDDEIERLQAIIDTNAKTADLLDRTLTVLEKQLEIPLEATEEAEEKR